MAWERFFSVDDNMSCGQRERGLWVLWDGDEGESREDWENILSKWFET